MRPDGWVLTNDHVVNGAERVTVKLSDGREFNGRVVRDFRSDLALVKIEAKEEFPVAKLGDSDALKVGYWAIAVGSPYGYEGTVSVGVISSLHRRQEIADADAPNSARLYSNMIQTDAAINPGNSGGPLYNLEGEVIGINTAIESESGGSVGIGFAIPINAAKFVLKQLIATGKVRYGYLGIIPTTVTPRLASSLKVTKGAFVSDEPEVGSPAARAGVHVGDVVISIDGKPINSDNDLRSVVAQTLPGTKISLKLVRKTEEMTVSATLIEPPANVADSSVPESRNAKSAPKNLGLTVTTLTPATAKKQELPTKLKGVLIQRVDPDSLAADNEDLKAGVVILAVNDTETLTPEAFHHATESLRPGETVRLLCFVEGVKRILTIGVD